MKTLHSWLGSGGGCACVWLVRFAHPPLPSPGDLADLRALLWNQFQVNAAGDFQEWSLCCLSSSLGCFQQSRLKKKKGSVSGGWSQRFNVCAEFCILFYCTCYRWREVSNHWSRSASCHCFSECTPKTVESWRKELIQSWNYSPKYVSETLGVGI